MTADRCDWLLGRVADEGRVTTNAAAAALDVSVDSIRRDLRALHERGLLRRVHGGAVAVSTLGASFVGRNDDPSPDRARLAAAIVERLRPEQVVGLDAGTTTTEIARRIPPTLDITIVTNNPAAALALVGHPSASVVLVGGDVDLQWMATTGAVAVDAIRGYHFDVAIVGACSFDLEFGATTRSRHEVPTKRAFIDAAATTLVPLESDKIGTAAPFLIAEPAALAITMVEGAVDDDTLERWRSSRADVVVV